MVKSRREVDRKHGHERLVIIAAALLKEDSRAEKGKGNYSDVLGEKNQSTCTCKWNPDKKVFRIKIEHSNYISEYLKTYTKYSESKGEEEQDDDCYWLHKGRGIAYVEAYRRLIEYGLFSVTTEQWDLIEKKGSTTDTITFQLGPFPSPDINECLKHLAVCRKLNRNTIVQKTPLELCNYIPEAPEGSFVGKLRAHDLTEIHRLVATTDKHLAITGMGGMGKSILAREYLLTYAKHYPGGICWLQPKDGEYNPDADRRKEDTKHRVNQLLDTFAPLIGITVDEATREDSKAALQAFWRQLEDKGILLILDDVKNAAQFKEFLPPPPYAQKKVTIIGTSRMSEFGTFINTYPLELPSMDDALTQLKAIVGTERIEQEEDDAIAILNSGVMDRLPLAVCLLGGYLRVKQQESLSTTMSRLINARERWIPGNQGYIGDDALEDIAALTDAQKGARAIFELTWGWLQCCTQKAAKLLPLFSSSFVDWDTVEAALSKGYETLQDDDFSDTKTAILEGELLLHSLINITADEPGTKAYTYHDLIGEFLRSKTNAGDKNEWLSVLEHAALNHAVVHVPQVDNNTSESTVIVYGRRVKLTETALFSLDVINEKMIGKLGIALSHYYRRTGNLDRAFAVHKQITKYLLNGCMDDLTEINAFRERRMALGKVLYNDPETLDMLIEEKINDLTDIRFFDENQIDCMGMIGNDPDELDMVIYKQAIAHFGRHPKRGMIAAEYFIDMASFYELLRHKSDLPDIHNKIFSYYKSSIAIYKQVAGERSSEVADALCIYGNHVLRTRDKLKAVPKSLLDSLEITREVSGNKSDRVKYILWTVARGYTALGDIEKAEEHLLEALEIQRLHHKEDVEDVNESLHFEQSILSQLGNTYEKQSKYIEAETLYKKVVEIGEKTTASEHHGMYIGEAFLQLGNLYYRSKDYKTAKEYARKSVAVREDYFGKYHTDTINAHELIAQSHIALKEYIEGEKKYIEIIEVAKQISWIHPQRINQFIIELAVALLWQGKFFESLDAMQTVNREALQRISNNLVLRNNEIAKTILEYFEVAEKGNAREQGKLVVIACEYLNEGKFIQASRILEIVKPKVIKTDRKVSELYNDTVH